MKFVKERVNVICQELARLSISQKIKITDMQVKNGCYITPAEADASKEPWTSFDTVNDRWYGPDKHYWFRTTITIPESFDGKNLWMRKVSASTIERCFGIYSNPINWRE